MFAVPSALETVEGVHSPYSSLAFAHVLGYTPSERNEVV
jgi:hypothetical protein